MCRATVVGAVADVEAAAGKDEAAREPTRRRRRTEKQTVPTGLSSVPPPGPAMPVMPTPTSAPSAATRPVGQRLGDLDRHGAHALDQPRGRRRPAPTFAALEYTTTPPST